MYMQTYIGMFTEASTDGLQVGNLHDATSARWFQQYCFFYRYFRVRIKLLLLKTLLIQTIKSVTGKWVTFKNSN